MAKKKKEHVLFDRMERVKKSISFKSLNQPLPKDKSVLKLLTK